MTESIISKKHAGSTRNIVLIMGQNAVGKTKTYNILNWLAQEQGIAVAPLPIKDMSFYLQWLAQDDAEGGYGHYHDWCVPVRPRERKGHVHDARYQNMLPFMVTSQEIIDGALFDFFRTLSEIPQDDMLHFVELTGGVNGNPGFESQSSIDVSFSRLYRLLYNEAFATSWLHRVLAVVHPYTDRRNRFIANQQRSPLDQHTVALGKASSKKELTAMDVFDGDDFSAIEPLFREYGTSHVYSIHNHFDETYAEALSHLMAAAFVSMRPRRLPSPKKRDIIMVMGQHSAGKPHILTHLEHEAIYKGANFETTVISDLPLLIEELRKDDITGGMHHYHPWCTSKTGGHDHTDHSFGGAFTVVGNKLIDSMQQTYFGTLNTLSQTGKLWLAEFSGGENINPFNEPAYQTDCSFKRLTASFNEGRLPTEWMDRVLAVIHPVIMTEQAQSYVNDIEYIHSLDTQDREIIREKRSEVVLNILGKDDFFHMEDLFKQHAIPHLYTLPHDGTVLFTLRLKKILSGFLDSVFL